MNAFYFGTSGKQLFGAYDPSSDGSRRGVVLCQPWAREHLLAYPTMRQSARRLAQQGWHALRFDYYGTGDSAGDETDATPEQWLEDIASAIEELKDIAQVTRIALVGMRLGATLAAQAARQRPEVDRLVLWDPVFDGVSHLKELGLPHGGASGGEAAGSIVTGELRRYLESLTPASFGGPLPRTLLLETCEPGTIAPLENALSSAGVEASSEHVSDVAVWREEWDRGGVGMAVRAIDRLVTWLT